MQLGLQVSEEEKTVLYWELEFRSIVDRMISTLAHLCPDHSSQIHSAKTYVSTSSDTRVCRRAGWVAVLDCSGISPILYGVRITARVCPASTHYLNNTLRDVELSFR